jgi:valyl-tRNA synthetase
VNEKVERDFELVQKVAKAIRSARSDYNIPSKTKTEAFIICSDETMSAVLTDFKLDLQTLSYCASIENVKEAPSGCAILTINAGCEVHLMLKGIIEVEKEVVKLEKKREQLLSSIAKLKQKMSIENYEQKVPENIQKDNIETLEQSGIEVERVGLAIESLKLM